MLKLVFELTKIFWKCIQNIPWGSC